MSAGLLYTFSSTSNILWHTNKYLLLSIIINLINLSSTTNHYLTMPALVIGTFGHFHIFHMILILIRFHLHFNLLLHVWISSKAHPIFIVSSNVLLTPQMAAFLSAILVSWLVLLCSGLTSSISVCNISFLNWHTIYYHPRFTFSVLCPKTALSVCYALQNQAFQSTFGMNHLTNWNDVEPLNFLLKESNFCGHRAYNVSVNQPSPGCRTIIYEQMNNWL